MRRLDELAAESPRADATKSRLRLRRHKRKRRLEAGVLLGASRALLGRDRLDLRVQLALVTRSLVAMMMPLVTMRVDDRLGRLERRGGLVLLAGPNGVEHLLDGGAQPRAGRHVVGAALHGLLGALFCGLDVRHEFGLQIEPRILAEDAREVNPRYSAAGMNSTPAAEPRQPPRIRLSGGFLKSTSIVGAFTCCRG